MGRRLEKRKEKKVIRILTRITYEEMEKILFDQVVSTDWASLMHKYGWRRREFQKEWDKRNVPNWTNDGWRND